MIRFFTRPLNITAPIPPCFASKRSMSGIVETILNTGCLFASKFPARTWALVKTSQTLCFGFGLSQGFIYFETTNKPSSLRINWGKIEKLVQSS